MYFSTAVALAALPFLVGAVPVQNSLRDVVSIPLSKRSTFRTDDGAVDTAGLQASIHHATAKFQRGFVAFERNTGKRHPLASKHSDMRRDHITVSSPLRNDFPNTPHSNWVGTIGVGTPAAVFSVLLDTASADLLLPHFPCTPDKYCGNKRTYNPSLSSTSKDQGHSPVGASELYRDNVYFGGFEATAQALGAVLELNDGWTPITFGADGFLGLAFKKLSNFHEDSYFETLVDQGQVRESVFGLSLAEPNPTLILGGRNSSLYKGNLTYLVVDHPSFWQTKLDGITVNRRNISVGTKHVIIDTYSTLVLGDYDSIAGFYANIPGSAINIDNQTYSYPCNATVNASINFGQTNIKISPSTFNVGPIFDGSPECIGGFGVGKFGFWVIGDVFLKNVYTEFDVGGTQIGFAPLA